MNGLPDPYQSEAWVDLPDDPQDRDMLARELLIKFQMSRRHPLVELKQAYRKF